MTSTAPVRGPYRAGVEKRRSIVEHAVAVFAAHGYRGGSLRVIADAVGVSASQIVALFGSKERLLTAVLQHWDEQQVDDGDRHGLAHVDGLRARMRYSRDHPAWAAFLVALSAEAAAPQHPAHAWFAERYESLADRLQAEVLHAAAAGEIAPVQPDAARAEARRLSALMDGLQLQWLLNPGFDMVSVFDEHLDSVVAAWRPRPVTRTERTP